MLDLGRSKVSSIVASSSRIAKKHLHVSVPSSIIHRAVEGGVGEASCFIQAADNAFPDQHQSSTGLH